MFFSKSLALQYEKRISEQKEHYEARVRDLYSQIEDLKKLVFSETSSTSIPLVQIEQDAILSQREEIVTLTPEETARLSEIESEADRIFSGEY